MSFLAFRYRYDGTPTNVRDDFGWLEMRVVTESRSGVGGFWVQWQDVKEFGEKLSAYPIEPNAPLSEQWGYSQDDQYEKVLGVQITPANARGDLKVRVEIADQDDPTDCVKTSFQTNYSDLAAFQLEIAQLMAGEIEEARLSGR
ncbi:MAG: hypothetical protein KAF42_09810 [Sphingopyxis terrae]|uniref:hypothetical protein n=1 Tax=unclassified Sphingopyxis TaxID=2614943 RepID=UPI001647C6B9|nr:MULTISPECIES: hypothetical protein [unclassified Sphingopyxis]MBU7589493.1 hypothetical protein [Sphingopyxis terrae]